MNPDESFRARADDDRAAVECRLTEILDEFAGQHAGMKDAIAYSLLGGGKRLRPLLCLWTHDAFLGTRRTAALDAACAIECVHTYSLVHDDLPCMDNDDLRRGKPSSHRRFGEATAVLVGDALLNLAYEVLARVGRHGLSADAVVDAVAVLATAAGTAGLITGQALDVAPDANSNAAAVDRIHEFKTARMIAASMELGTVAAGASADARERVRRAGLLAGSAFQIIDDVLDLEGSEESLGKTPGKDVNEGKVTFPSVVGVERARQTARERVGAALAAIPEAAGTPLGDLIGYFVRRSS